MKIIPIDRSSIKKNPNGGSEVSYIPNGEQITATVKVKFDAGTDIDHIISFQPEVEAEGISSVFDKLEVMREEGSTIASYTVSFNSATMGELVCLGLDQVKFPQLIEVMHLPEAYYFCDHIDGEIECLNCHKQIHLSEIVMVPYINDDGDEYELDSCPHCGSEEEFEQWRFEDISEIPKEELPSN